MLKPIKPSVVRSLYFLLKSPVSKFFEEPDSFAVLKTNGIHICSKNQAKEVVYTQSFLHLIHLCQSCIFCTKTGLPKSSECDNKEGRFESLGDCLLGNS